MPRRYATPSTHPEHIRADIAEHLAVLRMYFAQAELRAQHDMTYMTCDM